MGLCGSREELTPDQKAERDRSKRLDNENAKMQSEDMQIKKLLLLGAGESGKSTLFKQMISLYGKGYSEDDRKGFTNIIYSNTISSMQTLCKYSHDLAHGESKVDGAETEVTPKNEGSKVFIEGLKPDAAVDQEVANHIEALWGDAGIKATYALRAKFQLNDSAEYFFTNVQRIAKAGYIPTDQDVLRSRVRTTGIVETAFEIDNNKFKMFDVGGQRNERKKWIHCFENVTAVIFVAAISEYDQVLYEDENTNRMIEALNLFEEICNSRWFSETSMILFLNKKDLFSTKIANVPITICPAFANYGGKNDFESTTRYIIASFVGRNHKDKEVYPHLTCATDTGNIRHVFNAVKDIIIRKSLREGGLM